MISDNGSNHTINVATEVLTVLSAHDRDRRYPRGLASFDLTMEISLGSASMRVICGAE